MHDAEYTPEEYQAKKQWGHSSYADALHLALEAEVKQLGLFHHHQERTDNQIEALAKKCKQLAVQNKSSLHCFGVATNFTIEL